MSMIYTSFSFIRFLLGTGFVPNPVLDIRMTQMAETVPTLGKILVQRSHGTQLPGESAGTAGGKQGNGASPGRPVITAVEVKRSTYSEATEQKKGD